MIIKKYLANTEAEATDMAKKELGTGIVIMNVRSIKHKGIMRFFKNPMKEVTVALEEETERVSSAVKDIAKVVMESTSSVPETAAAMAGQKEPDIHLRALEELKKAAAAERPNPAAGNRNSNVQTAVKADSSDFGKHDKAIEEKLDNLQDLLKESLVKPEEKEEAGEEEKPGESENFIKLLYNTMIENEIRECYANQVIDDIEKVRKSDVPIDYLLAAIYQKMILKFGKPSLITPADKNPKVIFFIGPTGVGKTTTIAKIASKFSVEESKKVALLTTDTYRIAAAEQLRTYANILDVPFRVIYTVEEIEKAISDFGECDYILVDTAGHSHHNEEQKNTISEFVHSVDGKAEKEVYLVVSATTKYRDLISIAETYEQLTDYKLIFTKLDETTTLGNLFNMRMHTGAEMSYVTYGQNVPNDIDQFNPQTTVKQLLGGKKK